MAILIIIIGFIAFVALVVLACCKVSSHCSRLEDATYCNSESEHPEHIPDVSKMIEPGDCISRQAAIDAIASFLASREGGNGTWWKPVAGTVLERLPSAQPEQRWIPCSERLPDSHGHYLVTTTKPQRIDNIFIALAYWEGRWVGYIEGAVKAWMPLPTPWKGEEE